MKANQVLLALAAALVLPASVVIAQPVVKDAVTTIYAVVPDPESLSFAADGTLYAGRDNSGSGGGYTDAVKIHRVAAGGVPVIEFGNVAVRDPDVVIVDWAGVVSGTTGAVLVGGDSPGKISKIAPDGTVTTLSVRVRIMPTPAVLPLTLRTDFSSPPMTMAGSMRAAAVRRCCCSHWPMPTAWGWMRPIGLW